MEDAQALKTVEAARTAVDNALHEQREAVIAARLAGHSWADIATHLGVSRQAASERFQCHEQVAKAWLEVERRLYQIASERTRTMDPMAIVLNLSDQGLLHPLDVQAARELQHARNRSVHGRELTTNEAERVTEQATPLLGNLYRLAATEV